MTEKDIAVKVQNLTKSFKIPREVSNGIKQKLINTLKGRKGYREFTPLKDVSFEIKKGDFFGIVGRNGSGKSTLLKTIAGIYAPNKGGAFVNGTIVPFIELGVGFNPELTGRENVFLNGALLGFSRDEMEAMYDDIVDFAELHDFMEERLKNYSSGMQVRLAFSIAIRAKGDILLLDEVLAVGDEAFQRKCLDVFEEYKLAHRTVVLVTHDMNTVRRFCNKALIMHKGKIVEFGDPMEIADTYTKLNQTHVDEKTQQYSNKSSDLVITITNNKDKPMKRFEYGEPLTVKLSWPKSKKVSDAGVAIYSNIGECVYATNTFLDKYSVKNSMISCTFDMSVGAGRYYIMAGTFLDRPEHQVDFVVKGPLFTISEENVIKGEGLTRLRHQWRNDE